jgi:hypothetical protein
MNVFRQIGVKHTLAVAMVMSGIGGAATTYVQQAQVPGGGNPPPCSAYCYNVDIYNNTNFDANDLHVTVQGPTSFCSYYTGSMNPFGVPTVTTNSTTATSTLNFSAPGKSVKRGDYAHIGFCSNSAAIGVVSHSNNPDDLPAFYWTRDTRPVGDVIAVGHEWKVERASDGGIRPVIDLSNHTGTPIRVRQLDWAISDKAIALNELMWDGLADQLPWQQVAGEGELASGTNDAPSVLEFPVDAQFSSDDPRHIVFRFWAEDPKDPSNLNRGVAQVSVAELVRLAKNGSGTGGTTTPTDSNGARK